MNRESQYAIVRDRPRPIGKVVNAAAVGSTILSALVLLAGWLLDAGDVLPFSASTNATIRSVATLVAAVGGAILAGKRSQTVVEEQTTPLSDPQDADGRPLVPKPPSVPPRRPRSFRDHDGPSMTS